MLFKANALKAIKTGMVTIAFRKWKKPTVKEGGTLLTPVGKLHFAQVSKIRIDQVQPEDITRSGLNGIEDIKKIDQSRNEGNLYRIEFKLIGEDPRVALREAVDLAEDEHKEILKKLNRWDRNSTYGSWTWRVLKYINLNPGMSAALMANNLGMERDWLKPQIRKLKNLGLTISLETGYRISPRGIALLKRAQHPED